MLVNMVSIDEFSNAYGLLLLIQGISKWVGPPFTGYLYDISHVWYYTFGLGGMFVAISGILVVILPIVQWTRSYMAKFRGSEDEGRLQNNETLAGDSLLKRREIGRNSIENNHLQENGYKKINVNLHQVDTEVLFEDSTNQHNKNADTNVNHNQSKFDNNLQKISPVAV